jgi:hypothetical protein
MSAAAASLRFRMSALDELTAAGAVDDSPAASPFRWVAVVPVGPSATDAARLDDLLAALRHYEPNGGPVILLNDGGNAGSLLQLLAQHGLEGDVWDNPRAGRGNAWLGRLTAGLASAYRRIAEDMPGRHVLKLDTDALVTGPFAQRLGLVLHAQSRAGLVGSVELTATGRANSSWFEQRVYRMTKLVSRWDQRPYFRTSLVGPRARMRRLLRQAQSHGYKLAYAACGGAYLLTAGALQRLRCVEALRDERLVADDTLTEDIFFSIVVHACGLKVVEQNTAGDVFGVCWKGLPATSLDGVLQRHHAIIHSVKDHGPFTESATREFFRARRAERRAR